MGLIEGVILANRFSTPQPSQTSNPIINLEHKFGLNLPPWLVLTLSILAFLACLVVALTPLGGAIKKLWKLIRGTATKSSDLEYSRTRRRSFARHVESQLNLLSSKEDWKDDKFAELEAEVEVEGRQSVAKWLRGSHSREVRLRRERSLSRALEHSRERLIILQGEPGAGKSVALRHVAEKMVSKAARSRDPGTIPLYVNLKTFVPESRPPGSDDLRHFILASVRANDRDVEEFLEEEFNRELAAGRWLLLLDSFDEIPDILSATDSSSVVDEYTDAVYSFFHGMHESTGIIASREFKGPKLLWLPRFRIMQLTSAQQKILVQRSGLKPQDQRLVHEGIAVGPSDLRQMSTNPMFLSLVCEHIKILKTFPESSHAVYESYVNRRFERDASRILTRFGVEEPFVRHVAERAAFVMASTDIGLSPTRIQLLEAVSRFEDISQLKFEAVLNALEYIKLGRADDHSEDGLARTFTFAHRRFQEYFATCVVLREPNRVPVEVLLNDGRWRETTVTILQTQPPDKLASILDFINEKLSAMTSNSTMPESSTSKPYEWPPGSLHLLSLVDAGMNRRLADIPQGIRTAANQILTAAWDEGLRLDRRWATELALMAPRETSVDLLEKAFASGSPMLNNAAYGSASRLVDPPASLLRCIRQELVSMAASGRLRADRTGVEAELRRLGKSSRELATLHLLLSVPFCICCFAPRNSSVRSRR